MNLLIHIQNTRAGRVIVSCLFLTIFFSQKAFAQPTIGSISPTSASVGATVTIAGTNFNTTPANNIVFFGTVKATVTAASATNLSVTVPTGAVYGRINVLNLGTNLSATGSQFFTPVFSPNKPGLIAADVTFQANLVSGISPRLYSMGAEDLNNDGKPDLVMTSGSPGDNKVYIRSNTTTTNTITLGSLITLTVAGGLSGSDGQISFGDLNGDGLPDVVVPGKDANAFVILKNNGSLSFSSSIIPSALSPTGTVISDFDLDGKPDIAISAYASLQIFAYPNTTSTPTAITVGSGITMTGTLFQATQLIAADLDGDGKPEIIAPHGSSNEIHFYQNTSTPGSISFASDQSVDAFSSGAPFHNASFVVVGDLNNDGKPDMIVTDGNSANATSFAILRNTSTIGSFTFSVTTQQIGTAPYPQTSASLADMNGDGLPDLVFGLGKDFGTAGSRFRIAVLYNTSVGDNISFSSPIEYASGDAALGYNIITTDMNGDGIPDILVPTGNTATIGIYRGSPQFAPTISSFSPLTALPSSGSVVINGTGFNSTTTNNTVEFGTVTATITAASTTSLTAKVPINASYGPISVLNRGNTLSTSSPNMFVPAFTPNKSTLAATDFVQQSIFSVTGQLYGLAAGDLTGDGKPELVVTNSNGNSLIILPNISTISGPISFGAPTVFTPTTNFDDPRYVSIVDLDGNGWLDLVVPSFNLSTVGVFLNSGTGILSTAFTLTGSFATGMGPIGVATGDLDGDGKPDIVTSNNLGSSVSVLRNTSTNINAVSFAAKQDYQISATDALYNLALADIDNDGKLDIIAGRDINGSPGKVVLLRNTSTVGNISFAAAVEITGPQAPWSFVPGDLNGDGLTDFVASAGGSSATQIFAYTKNSTGGALTNLSTTQLNVTGANIAVGLADLNGDGKPDLISGTRDASPGYHTYIYPNTSTGGATSFGTRIDLPASSQPWSTLATDLNGDGRPDIVMGNQLPSQSTISIYRNTLIAAPVTQATAINLTALTGISTTFSWTNGSGAKRAVFMKASNTGTPAPVAGTDYTANTVFGSGTEIPGTGWFCVFNGTANGIGVTGLSPSTTYRIMVTEYNDGGLSNTAQYNSNTAVGDPITITSRTTITALSKTGTAITNANTVDYTLSFGSALIANPSPSNFSITMGGAITGATVTGVTGGSSSFTVTVNTGSGDGTAQLNFANTTGIIPGVTNTLPYSGETYTIDKTAPTLSTVTIASNNSNTSKAKTGDVITLGFISSEIINTPTITIAGQPVTAVNTTANVWMASYTMTGSDAEGIVAFNIIYTDLAGNAGTVVTATTNSSSVVFDRTAPALSPVTISSNNSNTSLAKLGNTVTLSFTASETINTPVVAIAGHVVAAVNSSGNNWTATYTMTGTDAEGVVPFSIAFADPTGNVGSTVTGTTNNSNIVYDITAPTLSPVTIASANSNSVKAKTGDLITLGFSSNENIIPSVTIAGHTVSAVNTGGNNWTASYTMTATDAEGIIAFSIAYTDASSNVGTIVTATSNNSSVVFDRTAPTLSAVTIVSNNTNVSRAKTGNIITLNFTADEAILAPVVSVATHSITAVNISGNAWSASYTMTGTDSEGTIPLSISFSDSSGNAGATVVTTTNSSSVVFDKTIPTLTSVMIVSNNTNTVWAKPGNIITVNFTASEAILVPIMTIAAHSITAVNTTANAWTAAYTMTAADIEGTIPFNIAFADISGNAGVSVSATTNSSGVVFDKTVPALSSVIIASGNNNTAYAKAGDVVIVSLTGTETLLLPIMTIATHTITSVNITGNAWTASYTMTGTDAEGGIPFSIAFTDQAGNAGISVTGTTDNSKVVYDITNPVLSVVSIGSNNAISSVANPGNTVAITFTASEAVLTPTVTLAGHTISATNTGNNTWAAAYTMQATDKEGTIDYEIVFRDIAGNMGTAVTATTNGSKVVFSAPGPNFAGGSNQGLTICIDAALSDINSLLRVFDNSSSTTITWSVLTAPAHGSLSGFNTTAVTNGGMITPAGLGYQPFAGYSGTDAFTVRVSDGTFSATTTIGVTVSALPSGSITSTGGTVLCTGSSLTLTASGGNTYKWFKDGALITGNSSSQLIITAPAIYTAIIVNAAGCETPAANSITVTQLQQPKAAFTPDVNSCINLPLQFTNASSITNSGTVSYLWNDGKGLTSTAISPSFSYTQTGTYNVKLKVIPQACPALADSITKPITTVDAAPGIRNPVTDVVKNQLTPLTVRELPGATYQWSPATFLLVPNVASPTIIATAEQEYLISQKVPSGCITVDTLLVRVQDNTSAYLPNVFTPNGDGQNDILMPNLVGVKQLRFFRIFNRWGKMLFETTNIGVGWDGRYKGILQPLDTYTWSIEGYDGNGSFVKRQGSVTLIR